MFLRCVYIYIYEVFSISNDLYIPCSQCDEQWKYWLNYVIFRSKAKRSEQIKRGSWRKKKGKREGGEKKREEEREDIFKTIFYIIRIFFCFDKIKWK